MDNNLQSLNINSFKSGLITKVPNTNIPNDAFAECENIILNNRFVPTKDTGQQYYSPLYIKDQEFDPYWNAHAHVMDTGFYQSFTAGMDGELSKVTFKFSTYNCDYIKFKVNIYSGVGTSGTLLGTSDYVYSYSNNATWCSAYLDYIPIISGNQYTMYIDKYACDIDVWMKMSGGYSGGSSSYGNADIVFQTYISGRNTSKPIRGAIVYTLTDGTKYYVFASGGKIYYSVAGSGEYSVLQIDVGGTPEDLSIDDDTDVEFVQYNNILYVVNSKYPIIKNTGYSTSRMIKINGTTATELTSSDIPQGLKYLILHQERLFGACSIDQPNGLYWSEPYSPEIWTPSIGVNYDFVGKDDGDIISGLYSYQTYLFVFKPNNIYRYSTIGDITQWGSNKVDTKFGAIAHRTIKEMDGYLYYLSNTAVVKFDGNNAMPISEPIEDKILALPQLVDNSHSWSQSSTNDFDKGIVSTDTLDTSNNRLIQKSIDLSDARTSGTADSGTTTTLVDSNLTQTNDYWNNSFLVITGGTNDGESRTITDFNKSTHTITFTPAMPSAIDNTSQYKIRDIDINNIDLTTYPGSAIVDINYDALLNTQIDIVYNGHTPSSISGSKSNMNDGTTSTEYKETYDPIGGQIPDIDTDIYIHVVPTTSIYGIIVNKPNLNIDVFASVHSISSGWFNLYRNDEETNINFYEVFDDHYHGLDGISDIDEIKLHFHEDDIPTGDHRYIDISEVRIYQQLGMIESKSLDYLRTLSTLENIIYNEDDLNTGHINLFTNTSADNIIWEGWEGVSGSSINSTPQQYIKWKMRLITEHDQGSSPKINSVYIYTEWESIIEDLGQQPTNWRVFEASYTTSGQTITYWMRSATTEAGISSATWKEQTPGEVINNVGLYQYIQLKITLDSDDISDTTVALPYVNSVKINYDIGTTLIKPCAVVWKNNYWLNITEGDNDYNNVVYKYNKDGYWLVQTHKYGNIYLIDNENLIGGTSLNLGELFYNDVGSFDFGETIISFFVTKNFKISDAINLFRKMYITYKSGDILELSYSIDNGNYINIDLQYKDNVDIVSKVFQGIKRGQFIKFKITSNLTENIEFHGLELFWKPIVETRNE